MIRAEHVCCAYGRRPVLDDVSLQVPAGQLTGVIGPNGSGKTTLVRALTQAVPLRRGRVYFQGQPLEAIGRRALARRIAVVGQDDELPLEMDVEDFIGLGRIPYQQRMQFFLTPADRAAVDRAVELTGTAAFRGRRLRQMSGGERQMVVLARVLAQQPAVLLLDEPMVYLDIAHQVALMDLIRRLVRQGHLAVLIVLHELNIAAEYCDQVALLSKGKLACFGAPEDVLTYPRIEAVYGTAVVVQKNPFSGKPNVLLVSEEQKLRGAGPWQRKG
ncbi:MAG: ABC transporter ATP-binding protein [Candidatus Omnitrophica bacterium]|nr:ABC transporter ATP-binding protein [Candidatus Omnitrophota bacterium]